MYNSRDTETSCSLIPNVIRMAQRQLHTATVAVEWKARHERVLRDSGSARKDGRCSSRDHLNITQSMCEAYIHPIRLFSRPTHAHTHKTRTRPTHTYTHIPFTLTVPTTHNTSNMHASARPVWSHHDQACLLLSLQKKPTLRGARSEGKSHRGPHALLGSINKIIYR